jgi:hypothetical protein
MLLLGGVTVAAAVARWLEIRGARLDSTPATPLFLAFAACPVLSCIAGRRVARSSSPPGGPALLSARPASFARRRFSLAFGGVSAALFVVTWILQHREPVPHKAVLVWLGSILAAPSAG